MDTIDPGPSEDQITDWNIHNDHADNDTGPDHDDGPDTGKILADIEQAADRIRAHMARTMHTGEQMKEWGAAIRDLVDGWAYLRWAIEEENAPLPDTWAEAAEAAGPLAGLCDEAWGLIANAGWDGTEKTGGWQQAAERWRTRYFALMAGDRYTAVMAAALGEQVKYSQAEADAQREELIRAMRSVSDWTVRHADLVDPAKDTGLPFEVAELAAKADHLAACAAAVDAMCRGGDLPWEWRQVPRAAAVGQPDPRVTANGAAATRSGWDLPTPDKTIGPARVELMGHRVRFGVVSEVTMFGEPFLRIDFPQDSENLFPEFYRPAAVYAITPDPPARLSPAIELPGHSSLDPDWGDPF